MARKRGKPMQTKIEQMKTGLGAIVHKHRIRHGYSLRALAGETEINYSTLYAIERGRGEVTMPRLRMLARVLGPHMMEETVSFLGMKR